MVRPTAFEVPEQMREIADKSVDEARKAFGHFIEATQKAVTAADDHSKTAQTGMGDVSRQALAYLEENVNATFDLAARLVQARTVEEMAALQQEYLRRQMSAFAEQGKGMGEMVGKAAKDSAKKAR
jgi:phasin